MSEEDLNAYKKYVSNLDITKYIVLDSKSNYWYSAEYVDKMLKKQDLEIERLNNIIKEAVIILEDYQNSLYTKEQRKTILFDTTPEMILRILKGSDKVE